MNKTQTLLTAAAFWVAAVSLSAQSQSAVPDFSWFRGDVERIIAEELRHGQAHDILRELCLVAPKRLSGSKGMDDAVHWGLKTMKRLGFENVRAEPCMVPHWERGKTARLTIVSPASIAGETLVITALGGSIATAEPGTIAEVIEVGSIGQLRAMGKQPKGRIVFFNRPMDPTILRTFQAYGAASRQRSRGAAEAAKKGGVAAIVRSLTTRLDDIPHTGGMRYEEGVPKIPTAALSTIAAERLSHLLGLHGRLKLKLELDCSWHADAPSANVVGEWRGKDRPSEIILLGAHLDAWDLGEGAHDDGAGCAQVLEVVRLLKKLNLHPSRTIRVVLFSNEENGLAGGRAYLEAHKKEVTHHVFALESDAGGFTPRGFSTNASGDGLAWLRSAAKLLRNAGASEVVAGGGGTDISPLRKFGVPLAGFMPDSARYFDIHHTSRDVFSSVHKRELELGAACIASLIFMIADTPRPFPRNPIK